MQEVRSSILLSSTIRIPSPSGGGILACSPRPDGLSSVRCARSSAAARFPCSQGVGGGRDLRRADPPCGVMAESDRRRGDGPNGEECAMPTSRHEVPDLPLVRPGRTCAVGSAGGPFPAPRPVGSPFPAARLPRVLPFPPAVLLPRAVSSPRAVLSPRAGAALLRDRTLNGLTGALYLCTARGRSRS